MIKWVLVVEDMREFHDLYRDELKEKDIAILSAFSIEEAKEIFSTAAYGIDAIVMDACVPGDDPTTLPLVQEFRKTFTGPMIAASSDSIYRKELMRAGCDYESTKPALSKTLLKIFNSDAENKK